MKKLSLIAALALGSLLACSTIANAQDSGNKDAKKGGKGRMTVDQRVEKMATDIKLTDDQKPKVKAVFEDTAKKMQDVPREERQEKMPAIRDEQMKKLKAILTPEQLDKYQKMQQDMRKKGQGGQKKKSE